MSGQQRGVNLLQSFSDGLALSTKASYLAVLPFVLDSLFLLGRYVETAYSYSFRFGAKFSLPVYFPSLTNVYDFPSRAGFQTSLPFSSNDPVSFLLSSVFYTVVLAYLAAGYLGKLEAVRRGESLPFTSLANKYFTRVLAYGLVWLVLGPLAALFIFSGVTLAIFYVLLLFVVDYFVFLTPFAIVAENLGFTKALNRSIIISTSMASRTLPFVILYGLGTLVISVPIYLVLNLGIIGFFFATAVFAFLGTALVSSTLCFYTQATRPSPPSAPPSTSMPIDDATAFESRTRRVRKPPIGVVPL
jgi:hypothetical protein